MSGQAHGGSATLESLGPVEALRRVPLFDPPAREVFDRVTRLASVLLDVPVALITLADGDELLFASCVGPEKPWAFVTGLPLSHSACQHAIRTKRALRIEDARHHALVCTSPAIGTLGIVAYLGVPLVRASGDAIGTLCAIDDAPRTWTKEEVRRLEDLGRIVMAYLDARPVPPRPSGGMNIAAVAQRTGIGADTLRKWERRYGVLSPARTAGGQRRYDERDVARVEWLRERLTEGFRIGEAAALLEEHVLGLEWPTTDLRQAIVAAAEGADPQRLAALVDQAVTRHHPESAIEEILAPALRAVGDRWQDGTDGSAHERLLAETIEARLRGLLSDPPPTAGGTVVLACTQGERHELGLLALAALLQADGWHAIYLGTDTPLATALATAARARASLLCLHATTTERLAELERAVAAQDVPDGLRVLTGGAPRSDASPLRLGDAIAGLRAVRELPA